MLTMQILSSMQGHKLFVWKNVKLSVLIFGILQFILNYLFHASGEALFVS